MRKPSNARLVMLSMIRDGRVHRSITGWVVCAQRASAADVRQLRAIQEAGWLHLTHMPLEEGETVRARLTEDGHTVLTHYEGSA